MPVQATNLVSDKEIADMRKRGFTEAEISDYIMKVHNNSGLAGGATSATGTPEDRAGTINRVKQELASERNSVFGAWLSGLSSGLRDAIPGVGTKAEGFLSGVSKLIKWIVVGVVAIAVVYIASQIFGFFKKPAHS